jgi:hypothetical protein
MRFGRVLAALLCAAVCVACASSRAQSPGVTNVQPPSATPAPACLAPGAYCAWDAQCCSGRCYDDTGCSG